MTDTASDPTLTKRPEELARIAAAAELVAVGHDAVRAALRPGASELELWDAARVALEHAHPGAGDGAQVDLMAGARTEQIGVPPGASVLAPGDPVLFDLAPPREGWWADSCATFTCGQPSQAFTRRHDVVRAALDHGIACARPGVTAGALDRDIRGVLDRAGLSCPHHTGHGVGKAPMEPPVLQPDDRTVLEEGMVLALEPGAYTGGFGLRLEHLVVIEADGARPLTTHSLDPT